MAKSKFIKTKIATFASTLMLATADVSALGLGTLSVQSNLDQPLKAVIELRVNPGDDVNSVKASIASKSDFENNGIVYQEYVESMNITLDRSSGGTRLRVDSSDVVIKEPFVSFLVRVDWSGGSFLREYTALIDPPVYAQGSSSSVSTPSTFSSSGSIRSQTAPSSSTRTFSDSSPFVNSGSSSAVDGRYGPVRAGETLSLIAQDLSNQYPDLGIYQIMKALFDQNPKAFINNNINGLIKGSVLEVGDINAIRAIDAKVAKQFFAQQAASWGGTSVASGNVKVGQDEYNDSERTGSSSSSGSNSKSFQIGESSDTENLISDSDSDTGNGEAIVLKQQVSELESSLASSSQENQALKERVSILEAQLADMKEFVSLGDVENTGLAKLEKSLADTNNAANDAVSGVVEGIDDSTDLIGEATDLVGDTGSDLIDDGSDLIGDAGSDLIDDGSDLIGDAGNDLIGEGSDLIDDGIEFVDDGSDGIIDDGVDLIGGDADIVEPSIVEPVDTAQTKPPVVNRQAEVGIVEKVKSAVIDNGLWKPIGGIGLALVGLIAFIIRRRRADEEFEISMLSIESNSQSINTVEDPSLSQVSEASVTTSVSHVEESQSLLVDETLATVAADDEKETSFLTVYSDSDAVVQADEVDPIAEADVYIAYGRHEQAEEVLLDGISNYPERTDIKHKLLTVYHKNENTEGFGRVAEELYSNRETLNPEMWGEICTMGKEIDSANPIYDLSVDDIATADAAVSDVSEAIIDESVDMSEETEAVDEDSIQLINFEEGQSEISSLDNVEIDALDVDEVVEADIGDLDDISVELESDEEVDIGDDIELTIQLDEDDEVDIESNSVVEVMADIDLTVDADDEVDEEFDVAELQEVSDLEIDADYDEQRTQFELAKVFADLGDEDGARKILTDIIADEAAEESLIEESKELLKTIT